MEIYIYNAIFYNRDLHRKEKKLVYEKELIETKVSHVYENTDNGYDSDMETGYFDQMPTNNVTTTRRFIATLFGKYGDKNISIHVIDYKPRFYIKIPRFITNHEEFKTNLLKFIFMNNIIMAKHRDIDLLHSCKVVYKISMDGYKGDMKSAFILFEFNNSNTRKKYYNKLNLISYVNNKFIVHKYSKNKPPNTLQVYEYSDDYRYKFYHDAKVIYKKILEPCGWIKLTNFTNITTEKIMIDEYEVSCRYTDILQDNVIDKPLPIFKTIAWDIETYPLETYNELYKTRIKKYIYELKEQGITDKNKIVECMNRDNIVELTKDHMFNCHGTSNKDIIFCIGATIIEHKDGDINGKWKNVIITIGKNDEEKVKKANNEEKYLNLHIIQVKNEQELIIKFIELIRNENPNFLYTFNGHTYDHMWLYNRARALGIHKSHCLKFSKFRTLSTKIHTKSVSKKDRKNIYNYTIIQNYGMVDIDIMKYFIGLNSSEYKEINLKWLTKYLLRDYADRQKVTLSYKDMYKSIYNYYQNDGDTFDVSYYCIYDCISLIYLSYVIKLQQDTLMGAVVTMMPADVYINSKQMAIVMSLMSYTGNDMGYLIPTKQYSSEKHMENIFVRDKELKKLYDLKQITKQQVIKTDRCKGGMVQTCKTGIHRLVGTPDVKSEYPNMIIAFNICPSTIIRDKKYLKHGDKYNTITWTRIDDKEFTSSFINTRVGVLPTVEKRLLAARNKIKAQMKQFIKDNLHKYGGDFTKVMQDPIYIAMDKLQLKYKVACNGAYGVFGSAYFSLFDLAISSSITQKAREYIKLNDIFYDKLYDMETVYGDTDSLFLKWNNKKTMKCNPNYDPNLPSYGDFNPNIIPRTEEELFYEYYDEYAKAVTHFNKVISSWGKENVEMELEKVWLNVMLITKKKYAGKMCEQRDHKKGKLKAMGMDFIKRNSSAINKYIGDELVKVVTSYQDEELIHKFKTRFFELIDRIYDNEFPVNMFVIRTKFGGLENYKSNTCLQMKIYEKIMELDSNAIITAGTSLEYVYIRSPISIGIRGGLTFQPKSNMAFPYQYLSSDQKIDYYSYIKFSISSFEYLLTLAIDGCDSVKDLEKYVLRYIITKHDTDLIRKYK